LEGGINRYGTGDNKQKGVTTIKYYRASMNGEGELNSSQIVRQIDKCRYLYSEGAMLSEFKDEND